MWCKRVRPETNAYLVEPNANSLAVGQKNFKKNGYQGNFVQDIVGYGYFTADGFMRRTGNLKLDILHADIQEFEVEMIDGAATSLSSTRADYVFVSTHSQELHRSVEKKILEFGYRVEVSADFETQTTSYDGFIMASSPNVPAVLHDFTPLGA